MSLLETVRLPCDVKALPSEKLPELAAELRSEIIGTVSHTGGHLASSLGAVELTIGLLRVFSPPDDAIVWDVGHQTYAWKILTGRRDRFHTLRRHGGISGFPNPEDSSYDAFVGGHAGVALAAAEGLAAARDRIGGTGHVVAVVGDASLANGESLEALNNCTAMTGKVILVVNDNAMSISKNVGSFARQLGRLLAGVRYNRMKAAAERAGHRLRLTFLRGIYHRIEQTVKSFWLGNALFESFGMRYIGPVDGHDLQAVEAALSVACADKRSVVVHVVTVKGHGFPPAERDPTRWHGVGPFDPASVLREPDAARPVKRDWSAVTGDALTALAQHDPRICALTAAMSSGTGLTAFARAFPGRFFDTGICESFLMTFAAGLAKGGLRPVVSIYSTFLQRAVDQMMHDVCLLSLPVVTVIDRAGVVGADGRTHQGVFDIPMLRCLPNLSILQPRSETELKMMLAASIAQNAPVVLRHPRGLPPSEEGDTPSPLVWGKAEVLSSPEAPIQIWALGDQVPKARAAAAQLEKGGLHVGIVNARFIKPLDTTLLAEQAARGVRFVTLENGVLAGGFGEALRTAVSGRDVLSVGWPDTFIPHGTAAELEADYGFTADAVAARVFAFQARSKEVEK